MEAIKPQQYTGIITKKLQLTKTVFHFFIQNENPAIYNFQPGQYGTFIIDEKTRRQYTFASAPDPKMFELVVDVSPMGPGSKYFLSKDVGDRVEYLSPLGNFTLSENSLKKIFVATGTGIAPFRSMILGGKEISNYSLYWGLRYEDDMYWDMEMKSLVGQLTGSQYFMCLSKPGENWDGLVGHVTEHVLEREKNLQNCEFYLCGNSAMIVEMEQRLSDIKVPKEQVKIDLFY